MPGAFLDRGGAWLEEEEARYRLILSLARGRAAGHPSASPSHRSHRTGSVCRLRLHTTGAPWAWLCEPSRGVSESEDVGCWLCVMRVVHGPPNPGIDTLVEQFPGRPVRSQLGESDQDAHRQMPPPPERDRERGSAQQDCKQGEPGLGAIVCYEHGVAEAHEDEHHLHDCESIMIDSVAPAPTFPRNSRMGAERTTRPSPERPQPLREPRRRISLYP